MTASRTPIRAVVAGGSLVGLSAALALSRLGIDVTVFERTPARAADGGGGLGVSTALLREVTGLAAAPPVLHGADRDTGAWHLLQAWLEDQAVAHPGIRVGRGPAVVAVLPGDADRGAIVTTADGARHHADLVIGADGARSTVRATVDPGQPDARYAGVLLWRTLVAERDLPPGTPLPRDGEPSRELYAGPYRLVTYLVPGPAGETAVGGRRLNLVWYDPEQRDLLHDRGLLDGDLVRGTLAPGALPDRVRDRLAAFAGAVWPSPWREALAVALATGTVFGTPIVHYRPRSLARGRVALAGDAAHAASPMVGGGFRQGLYDVRALTRALGGLAGPADVPAALAAYAGDRLGPAAAHVQASERATADYLAWAATRTAEPSGLRNQQDFATTSHQAGSQAKDTRSHPREIWKEEVMAIIGIEERAVHAITARAEITDAIYRYAAGLDLGDATLLESALTEDAVVDLTSATAKLGLDFPVLAPRDVVVGALTAAVGPLDTSHSITNIRIDITGDTATTRCYAQANHYLPGEGPRPDRTRHALMMNRYTAEMVRVEENWRIRRLLIDCAWFDGDPQVLVALV